LQVADAGVGVKPDLHADGDADPEDLDVFQPPEMPMFLTRRCTPELSVGPHPPEIPSLRKMPAAVAGVGVNGMLNSATGTTS
jgi:hypothetical protein